MEALSRDTRQNSVGGHAPKSLADELMEVQAGAANVSLMEDGEDERSEVKRGDVSMQDAPDDINPFSEDVKALLLSRLEKPLVVYEDFVEVNDEALAIEVGEAINIGE